MTNKLIPPEFLSIMGELPILDDEDPDAYMLLLGRLGAESGADTTIKWIRVKDVTDITWQILRIRRWQVQALRAGEKAGLAAAIQHLIEENPDAKVVSSRASKIAYNRYTDHKKDEQGRDGEDRANIIMSWFGLEADQVARAYSFFRNFEGMERSEELAGRLELRRERMLREIQNEPVFAANLRSASNKVIDAVAEERSQRSAEKVEAV
jgi:hypothetical protein